MRAKLMNLRQSVASRGEIIAIALTTILSFALSNAQILATFSPLGIAFCMAVPYSMTLFAFGGSLVSYILFAGAMSNGVYVAALIIACAVKMVIRPKDTAYLLQALLSIVSLLFVYLFSMITIPVGLGTWILNLSEIALCGGITYLFGVALNAIYEKKERVRLQILEKAGMGILLVAVIISISGVSLFGFNLARILGVILVVSAAVYLNAAASAEIGIIITLGLTLYNPSLAISAGVLIVTGYLTGIFRPLGKLAQVLLFLGLNLFAGAFLGAQFVTPMNLAEAAVGAGIFLLLPRGWITRFAADSRSIPKLSSSGDELTAELSSKLMFTATTLLDLQSAVEEVAVRLDKASPSDFSTVYRKTADDVCKKCGLNTFCWITAYHDVMLALNKFSDKLRLQGELCREDAPCFFQQKCCQLDGFINSVNQNYKDYLMKEQTARRVSEARMVAIEQFSGISDMLMEMSKELSDIAAIDSEAAVKVGCVLQDRGHITNEICCFLDRFDHMTIDIYLDKGLRKSEVADLTAELSDELDREFELPTSIRMKERTRLSFYECASFRVDFGAFQISNDGEKYCGDSYDYFMDSKGFAHMILSDGMGSGSHAAIDSTMTCSTLRRLIQSGFGFESAFKLMNLSFFVKSREESLATVDVCSLDLYTGRAHFIKAGAASSFAVRGNRVIEISSNSLPIGIIQGIRYDENEMRFNSGDIIVLLSDGVLMSGKEWIAAEIELHRSESASKIAKALCEGASKRWIDGHSDDVTVMVSKIK